MGIQPMVLLIERTIAMTIIKVICPALAHYPNGRGEDVVRGDCLFRYDAHCTEYDWCVVYDDFPRADVGTILRESEPLACPAEQTILVTAEPPSIKIYPECYTQQFGYVLTTHDRRYLPHPNHRYGEGCLQWMAGYSPAEVFSMPEYEKTHGLSTVCSTKQQKHTQHFRRFLLTSYLSKHLYNLDWYGRGVKELRHKHEALSPYKYHIAVENYIAPPPLVRQNLRPHSGALPDLLRRRPEAGGNSSAGKLHSHPHRPASRSAAHYPQSHEG